MSLTAVQLKERAYGIGASESAAVIGLSAYRSPLEAYLQKVNDADGVPRKPEDPKDRLRLEGGSALEPVILGHFERTTEMPVTDRQLRVHDPKHPWRWVTLDGRASDGGLVEAKKTEITGAVWGDGDEDVPDDYYCQAQHGMACTDAQHVYVPVLLPRWEFAIYIIRRDDEFIDLMTKRQLEFMERLRTRTPPPVQSLEDAKLMWPRNKPLLRVTADATTTEIAQQLANLKAQMKRDEEKKEQLELQIKCAMGEAEELVGRTGRLATWKNNKDGTKFDQESFAIHHPDLWRKYQVPKPGARVFLLKVKEVQN
ncbi:MAG TPA: YqaJ viral recombinase family protein [Steroidobacter sp.]|uniref:YqaJ viral recombinase family nuclease n=1 Tax=Steroidobacter sp. TaxID=1978227 RepID=UPI002EDB85AF